MEITVGLINVFDEDPPAAYDAQTLVMILNTTILEDGYAMSAMFIHSRANKV